jgi:tetratricopeptide (TPR) repeat protein
VPVAELAFLIDEEPRSATEALPEIERKFDELIREDGGEPLLSLLLSLRDALPLSSRLQLLLARYHEHMGDEAEAAEAIERARALSARTGGSGERTIGELLLMARLLLAADRAGEADRLLKPLAHRMQDNLQFMKLWAQIKHAEGRLTEAIRAFERVRALAPDDPSALLQLGIIHRLSQNPDAARRELELVGDHAIAKKHLAQMELERAFSLASRQQFTSAVEICDRLAEEHRGRDREIYKLAVLEKALLLESIQNSNGAIEVLEKLGRERGFEGDVDRLRCLARSYELRGTHEDLGRAYRVYAFLHERTGLPELLSRMARVAARRGEVAEAERLEARFADAFRREHHELSLSELLDAACAHYVPLDQLRALATSPADLQATAGALQPGEDPEAKRRLALLRALLGDLSGSAEIWRELMASGDARPEDTKYFGDVCDAQGDAKGARALYLAALSSESVADAAILDTMLSGDDPDVERVMLSIFADPKKRDRTYEALKHAAKSNQLSPETWTTLARFERLIGLHAQAERHEAKAHALSVAAERSGPRIGHVKVAAVYQILGHKHGIVHEIWASRYRVGPEARSGPGGQLDESSIFGNLAPDMMRDVQNVFVAVKTFVCDRFPHLVGDLEDHRYILKVTKDDEPSGGNSAGIAVALAFLSVLLQKPLPQDMAVTGALVADSSNEIRLSRVADVDYKLIGAYQRRLDRVIVPLENRVDLEQSHLVPRQVWEKRVVFAANMTQLMKLVFGDDLWEW